MLLVVKLKLFPVVKVPSLPVFTMVIMALVDWLAWKIPGSTTTVGMIPGGGFCPKACNGHSGHKNSAKSKQRLTLILWK
jgi:hypothetical protein